MILIKRYVDESPLAEVAAQMGLNTSAVAMRLQRGKLALRRVLTTSLRQEMAAYGYGVTSSDTSMFEQTPIWCPICGQNQLIGRFVPKEGEFLLTCPNCRKDTEEMLSYTYYPELLHSVKGYKPAYKRLVAWCESYYWGGLASGTVSCIGCGRAMPLQLGIPEHGFMPTCWRHGRGLYYQCTFCTSQCWDSLEDLVLTLPEGRKFWQKHIRIRRLPEQEVETDGQAAIVTRFESVSNGERFEVVTARDTYTLLRIYRGRA